MKPVLLMIPEAKEQKMKARFTLIEFMTVIAIIVVLIGIGMGA